VAPQAKLLSGHEEEPAPRPAHHRVPDERDHTERQLDARETSPGVELIDRGCLTQILRDDQQRVVEAKRHVPRLAGENQQDRGKLQAHIAVGEERDECEHDAWQEREDGNALQDVEHRHHDALRPPMLGSGACIDEAEYQRQQVRQGHAQRREAGVEWQRAR